MAGEQGSPAESEADAAKPDADTANTDGVKPEVNDLKHKYREALDRKRDQQAHANADAAQSGGKVHDAHGPARSRRSFRRKSG